MKNLKRILSLALASVMVMGMMVVGASAAFNDQADIDHATAVNTLVALGVISGKEGNNFDPDGLLTRAEMATILSVIRNRGVAPKFGTKTTPTFSDIKGHWAESYIEYCNSFGIVGGIGGGKYDPEGKLTATQAARMILNAMGYTIEDPSNWALLTEVQARAEGVDLYNGIDDEIADPTNAQITRQQMAQMTYNALDATMAGDATYDKPTSTTPKVYKVAVVAQASLDNDQKAALEALEFETASDANAVAQSYGTIGGAGFKYTVVKGNSATAVTGTTKAPETLGHKYLGMGTVNNIEVTKIAVNNRGQYVVNDTYTVDEDPSDLMGLKVQAIVKLNTSGAVTKTYGFNPSGKVVFEGTVGDIVTTGFTSTNKTIKLGGTAFKTTENALASTAIVAWNGSSIGTLADLGAAKIEYAVKAVSNNSRGTIDTFIAMPASIEEVKYVSATSITVGNAAYSIKEEEVVGYEGLKKGDLVQVTLPANTVDGVAVLAKPETATGTITGIRSTNNALIDGKWYTPASAQIAGGNALELGKSFDLVMLNGYYVLAKKSSSASTVSTDLVYVTKVAGDADFDGLTEFMGVTLDGTVIRGKATSTPAIYTAYTYEVKDGSYKLTAVADATDKRAGYEKVYLTAPAGFTKASTGVAATIGGKLIADDAVIVVLHDNRAAASDAAVDTEATSYDFTANQLRATATLKGSDAKKWDDNLGAKKTESDSSVTTKNVVFTETVNGIEYVKAAILVSALTDLPGAQGAGLDYGYVLTAPYRMAEGGKTYMTYDIWDGSAKVTVKDTVVGGSTIAKGDYISFKTVDAENAIITATELTMTKAAVTGYSAKDGILNVVSGGAGTTAGTPGSGKVTDKTVYIYLNHGENTGMNSDGVELAEEVPGITGRYYANVVLVTAKLGDTHDVVFVDVTNNIDDTAINGTAITNAGAADLADGCEATQTATLTNGKATLTVTATSPDGGVLTYNWVKQGETTSLGTSASIEVTAAGTYVCTITNTNNSVNGTKTDATTTVTFTVS